MPSLTVQSASGNGYKPGKHLISAAWSQEQFSSDASSGKISGLRFGRPTRALVRAKKSNLKLGDLLFGNGECLRDFLVGHSAYE